jgi:hypothetical protein
MEGPRLQPEVVMRVPRASFALVCVVAVSFQPSLLAQGGVGSVQGTVVSAESELPIGGALVTIDAGVRVTADPAGAFRFEEVVAGPYRIAAIAPGCHVGLGEVVVSAGVEIQVRIAVALGVEGDAALRQWYLGDRRGGADVKIVTAEDIERRRVNSVQDAIRLVAPDMLGQESGQAGGRQGIRGRARTSPGVSSQPLVVIDGIRLSQRPSEALASVNVDNVARIEVGKGTVAGWNYGLQGANGVIRIFTKSAMRTSGLGIDPERCEFSFPHG